MRGVAIIGAGIGGQHSDGFLQLPDQFKVISICDLDETRGRALAEKTGCDWTADYDAVLADPRVEIVDICLPPHLHFSACVKGLEAGKHVICEKPLVPSLAEADALAALEAKTGFKIFPVFQYRYGPGMRQLEALIAAGLAGKCYVGTLETHWNRDAAYYAIPWRGTWAGENGGALLGHAIHIHDMLPFVLGPFARVTAECATRVNDIEVEDCAALAIRMQNGALITSSVTLGAGNDTSRLKLCFEGFTVESDQTPYRPASKPWHFVARAPTTQAQIDAVLATVTEGPSGYAGLFHAVDRVLSGEASDDVTLADARRSLEFVTACYDSSRTGLPVQFPLPINHKMYHGWNPNAQA